MIIARPLAGIGQELPVVTYVKLPNSGRWRLALLVPAGRTKPNPTSTVPGYTACRKPDQPCKVPSTKWGCATLAIFSARRYEWTFRSEYSIVGDLNDS